MSDPAPEQRWQHFVAAARLGRPVVAAVAPPRGFVARVAAQVMQARREFFEQLWARWSWRAALVAAAAAAGLGWLVVRHLDAPRLAVPALHLELPLPAAR